MIGQFLYKIYRVRNRMEENDMKIIMLGKFETNTHKYQISFQILLVIFFVQISKMVESKKAKTAHLCRISVNLP